MRGRKPDEVTIAAEDLALLERIARGRSAPWFQVQRARAVLAIAAGQRTEVVAGQLDCDRRTVRRICCRYQTGGLQELLRDAPRCGQSTRENMNSANANRDRIAAMGMAGLQSTLAIIGGTARRRYNALALKQVVGNEDQSLN